MPQDALAAQFAALALDNIVREYPNKADHVFGGAADVLPTRVLHPSFYGSYDWHSCVHMHWLLARLRRAFASLPQRAAIGELFDASFAPAAIEGECAYLARPHTQSFERTYGWAWLLKLAAELALAGRQDGAAGGDAQARRWSAQLAPLAAAFVARYVDYLPRAHYPIRYGIHSNSAFGIAFALDYARVAPMPALEALCVETALAWYGNDRDAPASWEPSGADFLSPALMEADLMRRVLQPAAFAAWLDGFLPDLALSLPATLFSPARVVDRADPQIVHLDGLNFSRAWCLRGIASALPAADARVPVLHAAAATHRAAGQAGLASGDYLGAHWLATFALLSLVD